MKKLLFLFTLSILVMGMAWAATAIVTLRPTHIDLSSATTESAVLMTLSGYSSDDARYRLYNGSNQYNCWNEDNDTWISSTSYASGPRVPGTPITSTTFWIMFQRGNNNNTAASYRDRLSPYTGSNYQTVALPAATSIVTPYTLSGTYTGSNSVKNVVLAFTGTTLVTAASTTIDSGDFSLSAPSGTTIDKIEIRQVDNTVLASLTGSWSATTSGITISPTTNTPPTISPSTGNFYSPFNASISCTTEGATIYYTTNGTDPDETSTEYTEPIYIEDTTTLKAIAYAEGYDPSPIATAVYTFPEITEVADIATLRDQLTGSNVYRLTGEAILTFQQNLSYHPKWVQDATAAIYIYDTAGKITTAYNMGDGITGLIGTLSTYNSLLEFIPVADPGPASSTGNIIVPEERTLASLTSADQSKLIKVYNVTLGTTGNFTTGAQNILVTQGETTLTLRTLTSTDYNGQPIPQTPQNITCLVGQYNADIQITPRFLADFEETYDIPEGYPVTIGSDIVEITGGNANIVTGFIPPVNNDTFDASNSFILELLGAGPWQIEIQTTALWGAYYYSGTWYSFANSSGIISFILPPTKAIQAPPDFLVPIVLGDQDPTLPVELSSFTAVLTSDMYVLIKWIAESETNHSGYNILRAEKKDLAIAQRINAQIVDEGIATGTQISYSYTDFEAYTNMVYYYWLESVSLDGISSYYGPLTVTIGDPTQEPLPPEVLMATKLLNAYPNPFNPNTNIRYSIKDAGKVRIDIYNMKGQVIQTLTAEHNTPGFYQIAWDGCDANGNPVASGIYMYRMTSGNYSSAKKMVLAK